MVANRYKRSSEARRVCIKQKGYRCSICGLSMEEKYGIAGREFIHVHHIVPLNEMGNDLTVDVMKDLIPVCPNCHAMLHRKINSREFTIDELKKAIK